MKLVGLDRNLCAVASAQNLPRVVLYIVPNLVVVDETVWKYIKDKQTNKYRYLLKEREIL